MNLDKYRHEDATHVLECRHCIGNNCRNYLMFCILLPSKGKKAKVVVFGERGRSDRSHIKRIRYVDKSRLRKIKEVVLNNRIKKIRSAN